MPFSNKFYHYLLYMDDLQNSYLMKIDTSFKLEFRGIEDFELTFTLMMSQFICSLNDLYFKCLNLLVFLLFCILNSASLDPCQASNSNKAL